MGTSQLGKELSKDEVGAITAFLNTVTGEQPRVEIPMLPVSTAKTPRPEPLVRNSLEEDDAVERATPVR